MAIFRRMVRTRERKTIWELILESKQDMVSYIVFLQIFFFLSILLWGQKVGGELVTGRVKGLAKHNYSKKAIVLHLLIRKGAKALKGTAAVYIISGEGYAVFRRCFS